MYGGKGSKPDVSGRSTPTPVQIERYLKKMRLEEESMGRVDLILYDDLVDKGIMGKLPSLMGWRFGD